ncbi:MAG: deoxyhypusine synthase family protein [Candidatus Lokiarchaeota archaeon]|nr:deoxyhypusine synthase family protein [Candidatus Lokiarchaeota archaeon]
MKTHQKEDFLIKKVKPFNPKMVKNVNDLLTALKDCGFQGRNLGLALDILEKMVSDKSCLTVLTLSGAMVPAGMGELISVLMKHELIDILISTGANITHDLVDAASNVGHYIGSPNVDDDELFKHRINRIYDIFLPEDNYDKADKLLLNIIQSSIEEKEVKITPSEFLKIIGNKITTDCILSIAAKKNIPIFVPAFSDSELALKLIKYDFYEGYDFQFDILGDVKKFGDIVKKHEEYGTIIVGGGVPRNWAQQIFPMLDQFDKITKMGYNYSVRIHSAMEYDGGLSGSTFSEAKSWGKYSLESKHVSVWCDATIALPILITGLLQRLKII